MEHQKKAADPLPQSFKTLFYQGVDPPNLTRDFDVIGFDADHCLVKYNVSELQKLLIPVFLRDLHEYCGFPEEIMDFDPESDFIQTALNFGVWDVKRGYVLKLGEGNEVLAAMKGKRVVPREEILSVYGSPVPTFPKL